MMTEQQIVLSNSSDDLQYRWKTCVATTCYAFRFLERVKVAVENLLDVARQVINQLQEAFRPVVESLSLTLDKCKDLFDVLNKDDDYFEDKEDSFKKNVLYIKCLIKVNTRGYPRRITHCARSRC